MNWLLVLFIGADGDVLKTDLIFKEKYECFSYENKMTNESIDDMNRVVESLRKNGKSLEDINRYNVFLLRQHPRGTCVPTTSKVTVK